MQLNKAGTFNATLVFPSELALMFHTSTKGSDGLILDLVTDDGTIQHIAWLTPNAYAKSVETLAKVFGFDGDFADLARGNPFPRTRCSIVTEMEPFVKHDGSTVNTCKVKWLNAPIGAVGGGDVAGALSRIKALEGKPIARVNNERTTNPQDPDDKLDW